VTHFAAVVRNQKKLVSVNQATLKPTIKIYSSSGKQLNEITVLNSRSNFQWTRGTQVVAIGWTENEHMIIVDE
jgi:hypothetical protein